MLGVLNGLSSDACQHARRFINPGQTVVYGGTTAGRTVESNGDANASETLIFDNNLGQRLVRNLEPGERAVFDFEPGETVAVHVARPF